MSGELKWGRAFSSCKTNYYISLVLCKETHFLWSDAERADDKAQGLKIRETGHLSQPQQVSCAKAWSCVNKEGDLEMWNISINALENL